MAIKSQRSSALSTPRASVEMSVACGAPRGFGGDGVAVGIARKAVGVVQEIKHRADHQRAGDDANDERNLLTPRRGADELTGFRSCRLSFEMVAIENTIATAKGANATSAFVGSPRPTPVARTSPTTARR